MRISGWSSDVCSSDLPEDSTFFEALKLVGKEKFIEENVTDVGRELRDVIDQIIVELTGVLSFKSCQCEAGQVVNLHVASHRAEQDHLAGSIIHAFGDRFFCFENCFLRGFEDTIETPQYDEWQHYFAILRLLEVAP